MHRERALELFESYVNGNISDVKNAIRRMDGSSAAALMAHLIQYVSESGSSSLYSDLVRFAGSVICWA